MGAQHSRSDSPMYVELLFLNALRQANHVSQMRLPPPPTNGLGFKHGYHSLGGLRINFIQYLLFFRITVTGTCRYNEKKAYVTFQIQSSPNLHGLIAIIASRQS
jgi:hypothetical protein